MGSVERTERSVISPKNLGHVLNQAEIDEFKTIEVPPINSERPVGAHGEQRPECFTQSVDARLDS